MIITIIIIIIIIISSSSSSGSSSSSSSSSSMIMITVVILCSPLRWYDYDNDDDNGCALRSVGRPSRVFVAGFLLFSMLFPNFAGSSPEFHRNVTGIASMYHNFARISNWGTSKKGITTTRPSHSQEEHLVHSHR